MTKLKKLTLGLTALAVGIFLPTQANSYPTPKAHELRASCSELDRPDGQHSALCRYYLQGYLDALATGVNLEPHESASDFKKRALRTRADGLVERATNYRNGTYCLPRNTAITDLATAVVRSQPENNRELGADLLMKRVLREHYPCP